MRRIFWAGTAHGMAGAALPLRFSRRCGMGKSGGYMRGKDTVPIQLYGRRLSLSWMIQPNHVDDLLNASMSTQGLLSRFLLAYPPSMIGIRKYVVPEEQDISTLQSFYDQITAFLDKPLIYDKQTGTISTAVLNLDDGAKDEYVRLDEYYESRLAAGGINEGIRECANKATQHLARLAGVLAVFEGASVIEQQHLKRAFSLLEYYLAEWRSIGARLGTADPEQSKARRLLGWLYTYVGKNPGPFKLRPLYSQGLRDFRGDSVLTKGVLDQLIRRGYVRSLPQNQYALRPEGAD